MIFLFEFCKIQVHNEIAISSNTVNTGHAHNHHRKANHVAPKSDAVYANSEKHFVYQANNKIAPEMIYQNTKLAQEVNEPQPVGARRQGGFTASVRIPNALDATVRSNNHHGSNFGNEFRYNVQEI